MLSLTPPILAFTTRKPIEKPWREHLASIAGATDTAQVGNLGFIWQANVFLLVLEGILEAKI
ncbi:hypothetical protein DTL21_07015 [Bremerella cremea]|uniref:Uncharacterized protein n=1 Tax=Blastopirellula marina TaxID=124 RepID=A0A2S8FZR8_9BACT|nr:hypothetical protein C5Y83_07015 [Blastopirellula marina]RCS50076.1 hypothetical protein DTL21_07015 [Bremerella cremea]